MIHRPKKQGHGLNDDQDAVFFFEIEFQDYEDKS